MSYDFYKMMHFLGIFLVLSALGGQFVQALNGGDPKQSPGRRWIGMFHGIGLLLVLVAGFGMLAKLQLSIQGWTVAKLVIWIVLGGAGAIAARKRSVAGMLWVLTVVLGVAAAYLARFKPF